MKHILISILFFSMTGLIAGNVSAQSSAFSKMDLAALQRLKGTWKMSKGNKTVFEEWNTEADGQLSGKSYEIMSGTRTSGTRSSGTRSSGTRKDLEKVRIFSNASGVYYAPTAFGQNNEQEMLFLLKMINGTQYVFENKQHDFPQRISYQLMGTDSLHAYIEGEIQGKQKRIDFRYARQSPGAGK